MALCVRDFIGVCVVSWIWQYANGSTGKYVLLLVLVSPEMSPQALSAALCTARFPLFLPTHQHMAMQEYLSIILANELEDRDLVVFGKLIFS